MGWKDIFIGKLGKGKRGERACEAAVNLAMAAGVNDVGDLRTLTDEQLSETAKKVRKENGKGALSWLVFGWIKNVVGRE